MVSSRRHFLSRLATFKSSRSTEMSSHTARMPLCAAWDVGCSSVVFAPGLHAYNDGVAFLDGSPLGIGTYEIEMWPELEPGAKETVYSEEAA